MTIAANQLHGANEVKPVEINVLVSGEAVGEAASLTRRRHYWLRTILGAGYHVYLFVPGLYMGWLGARGWLLYTAKATRNWPYAFICAALVLIPVFLAACVVRDLRNHLRSKQVLGGRVTLTFTDDGVSGTDDRGFTFSEPWTAYKGFHAGGQVIVCPRIGSLNYLRIPIDSLSPLLRKEICSLLSRHLAELTREALRPNLNDKNRQAS